MNRAEAAGDMVAVRGRVGIEDIITITYHNERNIMECNSSKKLREHLTENKRQRFTSKSYFIFKTKHGKCLVDRLPLILRCAQNRLTN